MDSDGDNMHLLTCVDGVSEQCEVCRASDAAPHAPIARASAVAMFNEKLQADLLLTDDIIALHATDVSSRYPPLLPVRTENPKEVRGAFRTSGIGVPAPPRCIQTDEGGGRKNEAWAELRSVSTPGFLSVAMVLREEFAMA